MRVRKRTGLNIAPNGGVTPPPPPPPRTKQTGIQISRGGEEEEEGCGVRFLTSVFYDAIDNNARVESAFAFQQRPRGGPFGYSAESGGIFARPYQSFRSLPPRFSARPADAIFCAPPPPPHRPRPFVSCRFHAQINDSGRRETAVVSTA